MRKLKAEDLLNDYKEIKLKKRSDNTVDAYISDLKQYFLYLQKNFDDIKSEDIDEYIKYLLAKGLKPKTINRKLVSIHQFIEYLNSSKDYDKKIFVDIDLIKVQKQEYLEELLTMSDFERLVRIAEREKDYRAVAIFYSLYLTGVRVSELIQFKVLDIKKETINVKGKGKKYRDVLVPERLTEYFSAYVKVRNHNQADYLFVNENNNNPMDRQSVHNIIKKYAGLSKVKLSRAHAHNFRHLCALRLVELGFSLQEIAEILGHTNINTTTIYTRKTKQELINSIKKL